MTPPDGKTQGMKKRLPFGLDVPGLMEWGYRVMLALLVLGSFYLNTVYARKDDVEKVVVVVREDSKKVDALVDRVANDHERLNQNQQAQAEMRSAILTIQSDVTGLRATQTESIKNIDANFNRVFRKLDNLPR